jgi:hypothetical protein
VIRNASVLLVVMAAAGAAASRPTQAAATPPDVVINASDISQATLTGSWTLASDEACADGLKLLARNDATGAPKPATASAQERGPADYFDVTFFAPAGTPYRVWLRLRTTSDIGADADVVRVQFSDALLDGKPAYRVGSDEGLLAASQPCPGCPASGWGWHDSASLVGGPATVAFATGGLHTLRIQAMLPGVQLDQIVLSARAYLNGPPRPVVDDLTHVRKR